jgi:hypothetical protein
MKLNYQLLLSSLSLILTFNSFSQTGVKIIELKGDKYTVSKNFPEVILGKYLYEGKKEPIVLLEKGGFGLFQTHQMPSEKMEFWIDCDAKGVPIKHYRSKQEETEGRFGYTILYKMAEGQNIGKYDLFEIRTLPDLGIMSILGEREKAIK